MKNTNTNRVKDICRKLGGCLHPHPGVTEAEWGRWLTVCLLRSRRLCPQGGNGRLITKRGKHGDFLGCTRYPTCKHTQPADAVRRCHECKGWLIPRQGKHGDFLGCTRYPTCKHAETAG